MALFMQGVLLSLAVLFTGNNFNLVLGVPVPNVADASRHESIASELKNKTTEKKGAAKYFLKYGYLQDFSDSANEKVFAESIKKFQRFAGLNATGKLDKATKKQFTIPRCGLQDPILKLSGRKRRYLLQGSKWDLSKHPGRTLTWNLENTGQYLKKEDVRRVMRQAFSIWQKHANIFFKEETKSNVDIKVKFANGCHGDPYCFDFRGGTLAHAFYPYPGQDISGDVHFDNDEYYVIGKASGTDLLWVAVHELGHSLGLEHSNIKGAIMYPWYQGYKKDFDLTQDDQLGIQDLYGAAIQQPPTTVQVTTQAATTTMKPTTKEPTTKEPTTKEPTTEKPTTKEPTTKEPITEKPTTKEPITEKPTTKEPITEKPTTKEPITEKPTTKEPTTKEPTTKEPTTKEPITEKPTTKEPITEKPTTKKTVKFIKPTKLTTAKVQTQPTTVPFYLRFSCPKYMDASYISIRYKWMIVVSGHWLYLANRNGFRHGPLVKRNYFPRIKGTIDSTMVNSATGETIIFSGKFFYIYREFVHKAGPYPITDLGFSKDIQKIDASLKWKRNGVYYIFANDKFWRFNPTKPGIETNGYPKKIGDYWKGVPNYLSTAVTDFDQITRFTKGEQYYTLIDNAVRVESTYPERIGVKWMQCGVITPVPKNKVKEYNGPLVEEP